MNQHETVYNELILQSMNGLRQFYFNITASIIMLLKPAAGWTSSELYLQNAATERTNLLANMRLEN